MEVVFGFFGTDEMQELRRDGIQNYMDFRYIMEEMCLYGRPSVSGFTPYIDTMEIILMAMHMADKIHFVCSDLDLDYKPLMESGFESSAYTMKEYYAIMSTTSFHEKTVFYGIPMNPDAQIYIAEQVVIDIAEFKNKHQIS